MLRVGVLHFFSALPVHIQMKSFIRDTPSNPVYFRARASNGHMSFKQETIIYLVNSGFGKQIFGASNPVPVPLSSSSVKEKNFAALLKHSFVYF